MVTAVEPEIENQLDVLSAILAYIEGPIGALVMQLLFLSAISVATLGLWRIKARPLAVVQMTLVSLTIACLVNLLFIAPSDPSIVLFILLIFTAVIIPLYAAARCWLAGFRGTAVKVIALLILGFAVFGLRATVSDCLCGRTDLHTRGLF